jgi:hypothetical protein
MALKIPARGDKAAPKKPTKAPKKPAHVAASRHSGTKVKPR